MLRLLVYAEGDTKEILTTRDDIAQNGDLSNFASFPLLLQERGGNGVGARRGGGTLNTGFRED